MSKRQNLPDKPQSSHGALEAAGRGAGRQVERRKSTDPKVPTGTTESSPRFQPWVASGKWPEPRPPSRRSGALARREGGRGERKDGAGPVRSFVPDGTCFILAPQPSDESLGYFQASLRDLESRHAKRIHERETIYRSSANMAMGLFYAPETSKTQRQQSALSPR